ncbi:phospholipase D-like domain-containing protein [Rhodoligotrophos defluvii]|uniref:phospholipase D-like domain-containing protein n=1 Tax=Rhodoligotrophos defluvii TaxID=2561934 RepID=UPI0010C95F15|nr:phospholipase D-like domain-containing protein [Rhodoligotrophos defluvii]
MQRSSGEAVGEHARPVEGPTRGRASLDRIIKPGQNCWCVAQADRATVLVDGAAYFGQLEAALRAARHAITILGWDFDGRIRLRADQDPETSPPLGWLLRKLVEESPTLEVRILVWSMAVLHAPGEPTSLVFGAAWQEHPRIHVKLDTHHPVYAAHHQKIVCIDDQLAFVGGMDLTVQRWDDCTHSAGSPFRLTPDGRTYRPVHDIQMLVDGDAARKLCTLARERWQAATGEALAPCPSADGVDLWPTNLAVDFRHVPVAIARTMPVMGDQPSIEEAERLTLDALRAARRSIYIEAQYLTARSVGRMLCEQLERPDGPEIVAVITYESSGVIERFIMANNRDRLLRTLAKADRHGRFYACYPVVPSDGGEQLLHVHSKLIIVDDRFLRVGSSNLNNRSAGLDSECDLGIEAATPDVAASIRRIRDQLLAEHLGKTEEEVTAAIKREGLIAAVKRFSGDNRGLRPFPAMSDQGPKGELFGTALLDPKRPYRLLRFFKPRIGRRRRRR